MPRTVTNGWQPSLTPGIALHHRRLGTGVSGVKLCPGALLAGGAEHLWSPTPCQGLLCRAGGCIQTLLVLYPSASHTAQLPGRLALPVPAWCQGDAKFCVRLKGPQEGFHLEQQKWSEGGFFC